MEPLRQWICDDCGGLIEKHFDGYAIWQIDEQLASHSFKIVHNPGCKRFEEDMSLPLGTLLGSHGLNELLSMLDLGPIRMNLGDSSKFGIVDLQEFVDFFRRVQVPHYEEARQYFDNPDVLEWCSDANEVLPYLPDSLQSFIKMGKAGA